MLSVIRFMYLKAPTLQPPRLHPSALSCLTAVTQISPALPVTAQTLAPFPLHQYVYFCQCCRYSCCLIPASNSEGLREAMSCDVCSEVYERTFRTPLVLPCGHTFCRFCLVALKKQDHFLCPSCRAVHNNVQVEKLTVNFSLLNILPFCNEFTFEQCNSHGDDLRYWCCTCDLPLCSLCLYSGHPQGHIVKLAQTFVQEKKQELIEKIKLFFGNIEEQKKELQGSFSGLDAIMEELFHKNACLHDKLVDLTNLLDETQKASDISSVRHFEKAVKNFKCKEEDAPSGTDVPKEKAQDSEPAKAKNYQLEDKAATVSAEPCQEKESSGQSFQKQKTTKASAVSFPFVQVGFPQLHHGRFEFGRLLPQSHHGGFEFGRLLPQSHHGGFEFGRLLPQSHHGGFEFGRLLPQSHHGGFEFGRLLPQSHHGRFEFGGLLPQSHHGGFEFGGAQSLYKSINQQSSGQSSQDQETTEAKRATIDYRDGRLLLHSLAKPNSRGLSFQMPSEVFLELSVDGRCLGRIFISLWCHMRRAQQFLALCMGTMGPTLLDATASEKVRNILAWRYVVDGDTRTRTQGLLTNLEWGGQCAKTETEGYVAGLEFGNNKNSLSFGICTQSTAGAIMQAPFGRVVSGLEVVKAAFQHNPITEVKITNSGLVLPHLSL